MTQPIVGSFSLMKKLNTTLILRTIRELGPIPRTEIAKVTGLTAATVSNITAQLIKKNLIVEAEVGKSNGGRKPIMLEMCGNCHTIVGVYIGSKHAEIIQSDLNANILKRFSFEITSESEPLDVLAKIVDISRKELMHESVLGMGIGLHGVVNKDEGVLMYAPNLKWERIPVREFLSKRTGLTVFVDNDVRLMTMGEKWFGVAKQEQNFVYLYVGYGIGGSLVINDEIYRGETSGAGEIGHTTIKEDGPRCECGNRGCLQAFAAEVALMKRLSEYLPRCEGIEYALEHLDLPEVRYVFEQEAKFLGIGVANLINMFNPSLVVINGRITRLGDFLKDAIEKEAFLRSIKSSNEKTRIVFSTLGAEAALKGAVAIVLEEVLYK